MHIASIEILPQSKNYCHVIYNETNAILFDPGEANPILQWLQRQSLQLTHIFITHHHWDHTDGINAVTDATGAKVITSTTSQINADYKLDHLSVYTVPWLKHPITAIHIPGHTLDHCGYLIDDIFFSGDTLFSLGCGRVFEGTYPMMLESLQRIAKLPEDTKIYFAHEYTRNNAKFALYIEPDNEQLRAHLDTLPKITVPTTLAFEKQFNPFLRTQDPDLHKQLSQLTGQTIHSEISCFTTLRQLKDNY